MTIRSHRCVALIYVILLTVYCTQLYSQATYTTLAGTKYLIASDGTYAEDTAAVLIADNPFEVPVGTKFIIEDEELYHIRQMKAKAEEAEIRLYAASYLASEQGESSKSQRDQWNKARKTSELLQNITQRAAKDRQKAYRHIEQLGILKVPNRLLNYKQLTAKIVRTGVAKSDHRFPLEIIREQDCNIIFDGKDASLKKKRKETEAAELFAYTNPRLQRHFIDKDFIEAKASLARIGRKYYLALQIDIDSKSASQNYGVIKQTATSKIAFINGRNLYLRPRKDVEGKLQEYTGHTIYKALYQLEKEDFSMLEKYMIDEVGIMWSSGYETYDVYHVDVLKNLAQCLKK